MFFRRPKRLREERFFPFLGIFRAVFRRSDCAPHKGTQPLIETVYPPASRPLPGDYGFVPPLPVAADHF